MHPDALKMLRRLFELVESGVLPDSTIHRMVYHSCGGHKLRYSYQRPPAEVEFKCVTCLLSFPASSEPHACSGEPEIYDTNPLRTAHWECVVCHHEWDAEDADLCPECLAGPTTGTLALFGGPQPLPDSTREKYPILRELNNLRMAGVPVEMLFERFAEDRGLVLDDALLLVSEEWWRRVTGSST